MSTLAVIILTKNEERNITAVIQNAQQVTDEVIIVDSGSTDDTIALAQKAGAKTTYRAWDNDFAAQRNFGLTQTQADWILYLDADERLNPELVPAVKRFTEASLTGDNSVFQGVVERKSVAFGQKFEHGVLKPDYVARLFPRTQVNWVSKVHEHPECALPPKQLAGHLEHYTYVSWQQWEQKFCQYTTIWAQEAYKNGKRTTLTATLLHSIAAFIKMFILRLGFLDGLMGVFMCCNHFFYTMLKYLKLYDLQRKSGQ